MSAQPDTTARLIVERLCVSCGTVSLVVLGAGCPACEASCFALRPLEPRGGAKA